MTCSQRRSPGLTARARSACGRLRRSSARASAGLLPTHTQSQGPVSCSHLVKMRCASTTGRSSWPVRRGVTSPRSRACVDVADGPAAVRPAQPRRSWPSTRRRTCGMVRRVDLGDLGAGPGRSHRRGDAAGLAAAGHGGGMGVAPGVPGGLARRTDRVVPAAAARRDAAVPRPTRVEFHSCVRWPGVAGPRGHTLLVQRTGNPLTPAYYATTVTLVAALAVLRMGETAFPAAGLGLRVRGRRPWAQGRHVASHAGSCAGPGRSGRRGGQPAGRRAGGGGDRAKLSRLLHAFLKDDIVPQAERAAGLGLDPTPLLAVVADVLDLYVEALKPPGTDRPLTLRSTSRRGAFTRIG
jgi:hypothetical protein